MRSIESPITRHPQILIPGFLLLLALALVPVVALAQSTGEFDPYPLRPADTSSPRATLRTFLENVEVALQDGRRGEFTEATARAYLRATVTLDFSTTPASDSWVVRNERAILLKEILDRIELPPNEEIPGETEVADGTLTEWTIPNTNITIARIKPGSPAISGGARPGDFLFSAETVQRLHRFYAHAQHLPYKPGAEVGLYEEYLSAKDTVLAQERQLRNRLRPVDTSNPRSTLEGFFDSVNRAYTLAAEADAALRATPPTITEEEAQEIEVQASNLLLRAVRTLDLSQVPEAFRQEVGVESALQLKEIIDRMRLPPVDTVPDARMVAAASKAAREQESGAVRWRYPNTQIEIVEVTEGDRLGQFLFSAATVNRLADFYAQVKDLPYRTGLRPMGWISPDKSEGFYEDYISTPGYLVAYVHPLGKVVDKLPAWLKTEQWGQRRWQWIGLLLSMLTLAVAAYGTYRFLKWSGGVMRPPWDRWLMILAPVTIALIVGEVADFLDNGLNVTGELSAAVLTGGRAIIIAMWAWAVYVLCMAVAETIIATPRMRELRSEAALLRLGAGALGVLIAAWIVIAGVRALGAELIPILAGLGVGGLAVALAAQTTIANFIGGLILYINKPVRVGDFCRYGEDPSPGWLRIGDVEEIGWISTRIRGIDRTLTTIPNAEFSKMHIVNLTVRDQRLVRTTLQLRYETTPEQMRYLLVKLRELLLGHPMVTPDPARVRFVGYGPYSKDVEIFAYLRCQDQNTFLAIQEDIFLRIEDIIKSAGTGFAIPSQTTYLTREAGLDAQRRDHAEADIQRLRATGKLPFPEFEEEVRDRLEDILDYPPKGSPNYTSSHQGGEASGRVGRSIGGNAPYGEQ